jgi:hypothetical protein
MRRLPTRFEEWYNNLPPLAQNSLMLAIAVGGIALLVWAKNNNLI